jgi:hypothetical protein
VTALCQQNLKSSHYKEANGTRRNFKGKIALNKISIKSELIGGIEQSNQTKKLTEA